jgi:hypothetical protein
VSLCTSQGLINANDRERLSVVSTFVHSVLAASQWQRNKMWMGTSDIIQ